MSVVTSPLPVDDQVSKRLIEAGSTDLQILDVCIDITRRYHAIMAREPIADPQARLGGRPDLRWHISVSGEKDVPRWKDLVAIAHRLRPGVCFVVGVPPRSWWLNVHPHCLHLWEVRDPNLTDQWRFESRGDKPS